MKIITNLPTIAVRKIALVAVLALLGSLAAAQIGYAPEATVELLAQYELEPTEHGYVAVGTEFEFEVISGSVLAVRGNGPLGEPQLRFIGSLIGAASGYGADMAGPVTNYLRQQQDEFAGVGPIMVEVGDYHLLVQIDDTAERREITFGLTPQVLDNDLFLPSTHALGPADAQFVMRVFSDFECPYCAQFEERGMPLVREFIEAGNFRFEFHHFPLRSHPNAALVAETSECIANLVGEDAFWNFHDTVFANQTEWAGSADALSIMLGYAKTIGADHPALQSCVLNGDYADVVASSYNHGLSVLNVTATPTVFINGVRFSDYTDPGAYERAMRIAGLMDYQPETP